MSDGWQCRGWICFERLLTVFGNAGSVAFRRSSISSDKLDVPQMFDDVPNEEKFAGSRFAATRRKADTIVDAGR